MNFHHMTYRAHPNSKTLGPGTMNFMINVEASLHGYYNHALRLIVCWIAVVERKILKELMILAILPIKPHLN